MPRPRKGPRIYRRPDRPGWWGAIDGKRHISLGEGTEAEALDALAAHARERGQPEEVAQGDAEIVWLIRLCVERSRGANTQKTTYELALNLERVAIFLEARGVRRVREVTQSAVEDFKTARRFTVGAARVNRELDSWKRLHRVAFEEKLGTAEPLEWFKHLREPRPAPHHRAPSKRDLQAFLRHVALPYRHLFRAVLGCALRDEEMRHLEADDVHKAAVMVTPKPGWSTKGYRYREVPASPATVKAARAWLATRGGVSIDKKKIWLVAREACAAAGVAPMSLHDLRHACASHWLASGIRVAVISSWLGHADLLTTLRYLGIVEAEKVNVKKLPW